MVSAWIDIAPPSFLAEQVINLELTIVGTNDFESMEIAPPLTFEEHPSNVASSNVTSPLA
jgi:hypothetical protein